MRGLGRVRDQGFGSGPGFGFGAFRFSASSGALSEMGCSSFYHRVCRDLLLMRFRRNTPACDSKALHAAEDLDQSIQRRNRRTNRPHPKKPTVHMTGCIKT